MDFDMSNMMGMLAGMQQRVADMKAAAKDLTVTGEAGGGMVKVTMQGDYEIISVSIDEGAMDDRELLEDLVRAATGEALRQVKAETAAALQKLTGGLPIPPGLLPF